MFHEKAISMKSSHFLDKNLMLNITQSLLCPPPPCWFDEGCIIRSRKIMNWVLKGERWSNFFFSTPEKTEPVFDERIDSESKTDFTCGKLCNIRINLEDFIHAKQKKNLDVLTNSAFIHTPLCCHIFLSFFISLFKSALLKFNLVCYIREMALSRLPWEKVCFLPQTVSLSILSDIPSSNMFLTRWFLSLSCGVLKSLFWRMNADKFLEESIFSQIENQTFVQRAHM